MRFFFHMREASGFREDSEGADFASLQTAQREAWESARDIIAERIKASRSIDIETTFEVADEAGIVVFEVRFADVLKSCL